jgi:plastocyanin
MGKLLAVLAVLGVVLVGCGKSSKAPNASGGGPTTSSAGSAVSLPGTVNDHGTLTLSDNSVTVTQHDFYFGPTFVKGKAGTNVTVTVKNDGSVAHTFTIDAAGVDKTLQPGDSVQAQVVVPASGVLNYYCRFHRSLGMQGAIVSG